MIKAQSDIDLLINVSLTRRVEQLTAALRLHDRGHAAIPANYGRFENGLREWRAASISTSQRQEMGEASHNYERERARRAWAALIAAKPDATYLRKLRLHQGAPGPLRVFVLLGGGGLGDGLMHSPFVRELKQRLAPCELVFGYGRPVVEALYANSPEVDCAVGAPWDILQECGETLRWLGIFDLYVDIFCFLPRYHVCEGARIDFDRHGEWLAGNMSLTDIIERFSNNLGMTILDRAMKVHAFDLVASISGLPLDSASPLGFTPDPAAIESVRNLELPPLYVTVRDGCSSGDLAFARKLGADRTTKQLSPKKWQEVRSLLGGLDVQIVQVGDSTDHTLDWVDRDLKGKTSLSELCFVFKNAVAHFDTEGALAHFARASHAPAFVCFGTTSAAFFGYKGNVNLESDACCCCWYTTDEWLALCPRKLAGVDCTDTIDLEPVKTGLAALKAARLNRKRRIAAAERQTKDVTVNALVDWASAALPNGSCETHVVRLDASAAADLCDVAKGSGDERSPVARGSIYNLPINSGTLARVCFYCDVWPQEPAQALEELFRILAPGGALVVAFAMAKATDKQAQSIANFLSLFVDSKRPTGGLPSASGSAWNCYALTEGGSEDGVSAHAE